MNSRTTGSAGQRHFGFQQGHAQFAAGAADLLVGQAALAAQGVEYGSKALAEIFKHGMDPARRDGGAGF
jgi:hypothetical protein